MTQYQRTRKTEAGAVTAYRNEAGNAQNVPVVDGRLAEVPEDAHEDLLAESDMWEEVIDEKAEEAADEPTGYAAMDYKDLQAECKERGLNAGGSTEDLIERLQAADEEQGQPAPQGNKQAEEASDDESEQE